MIWDLLENWESYRALGTRFARAFEALAAADWSSKPLGRHDIDGDYIFALVQENAPLMEGRWESHRRYADIQLVLRGVEGMMVAPAALPPSDGGYQADRDIEFYQPAQGTMLRVAAGQFALFLPQDFHQPNLRLDRDEAMKKVVVKVLL